MTARRIYSRLRDLLDVTVSSPSNGQVLTYNNSTGKWENQAGGGGSQPFTPTDLDDLALWLDASTLALADDDPVALWPDASPNGYDAAQATADNQPVCKTNVLNGLRVVRFDPSVNPQFLALSGAGLDLFRATDGFTVAAVASQSLTGGDGTIIWITRADDANAFACQLDLNPQNNTVNFEVDPNAVSNEQAVQAFPQLPSDGPVVAFGVADFVHATAVVGLSSLYGTGSGNTVMQFALTAGASADASSLGITVGSSFQDPTFEPLTGDIAEVVVYRRALPLGERRQLMEYLSAKWAVV